MPNTLKILSQLCLVADYFMKLTVKYFVEKKYQQFCFIFIELIIIYKTIFKKNFLFVVILYYTDTAV